ncbi:MAG: hypothetical protein EBX40_05355 [Gammaproteobacteria bacterium]|nr:hypothetical protein [Gammaproteobacteria bacterium]
MTHELREELVKFIHDTPAYGAIIITKLANPEPNFYNPVEEWLYHHGWSIILIYRLYRMIIDIHKENMQQVLWHDDNGELVSMTLYAKKIQQIKSIFK